MKKVGVMASLFNKQKLIMTSKSRDHVPAKMTNKDFFNVRRIINLSYFSGTTLVVEILILGIHLTRERKK